jgi:hypothetical protein
MAPSRVEEEDARLIRLSQVKSVFVVTGNGYKILKYCHNAKNFPGTANVG